jgi:hypothetical protein
VLLEKLAVLFSGQNLADMAFCFLDAVAFLVDSKLGDVRACLLLRLLRLFLKSAPASGGEIGRRHDVVTDIEHIEAGRVLHRAPFILGQNGIHIFKLVLHLLLRPEVRQEFCGLLLGNSPARHLGKQVGVNGGCRDLVLACLGRGCLEL